MKYSLFSRNGEILDVDKAVIPLGNIEYMYGFGVYESMKVRKNILYFVEQHVDRLLNSANLIQLEHTFTKKQIITYIDELVKKLAIDACNIKMLLIGAEKLEEALLFIIPLSPLFPERKLYTQGTKVMTVNYTRWNPHAKSLNMLPSYLAYRNAKREGCYDGLLVDDEGNILEGTRTNFFTIKGKTIYMPSVENVLEGVTLMTVLYVAKRNGYTIKEGNISVSSVSQYDGAFLTSTSSKIIPIKQIDRFIYPEITQEIKNLMDLYDKFLEQSNGIFY